MFTYENGLIVAFLIGVYRVVYSFSMGHSLRASNLAKVGIHYRYWSGGWGRERESTAKRISYCAYVLLLAPLFSWLFVGFFAVLSLVAKVQAPPVPEKIKEVQFKMATADLSKDDVERLVMETAGLFGPEAISSVREDLADQEDRESA